jgi:putative tryptophan/tyrosine transport system substrate-binding protein
VDTSPHSEERANQPVPADSQKARAAEPEAFGFARGKLMGRYVVWGTKLLTGILVVFTSLVLPRTATAQRPGHLPQIAFLGLTAPPATSEPTPFLDAFRQGLRERGWVEGHTITIEWRWAEGNLERFASLVAEATALPIKVLVVPNATTALIAKKATTTIPIVVVTAGTMQGLVASLARPEGNVTGLTTMTPELALTHLELLKEALPAIARVAVLEGLSAVPYRAIWPALEATARSLGLEVQRFEVREPAAFDSAFVTMTHAHIDALIVLGDPFFDPHLGRIAALAVQHRLPSIGPRRGSAEAGSLLSYGANLSWSERGQRIAAYVDRILKGATPADLPVERPMNYELIINLKTARALGLTLSPTFLFRAHEVIQ